MRLLLTAFCMIMACLIAKGQFVGLVVNEFSQGASGNKEYIEIVVVGNRTCTESTADLRGWIVDDQNGWYGNSSSSVGHYRFKNDLNWASVPFGSVIVLYNKDDKNSSITLPDDSTDANGDLTYIVPIGNNLIEQYNSAPDNASGVGYNYPAAGTTTGYSNSNNQWAFRVAFTNGGDVISLVSPTNRANAFFSVGYGYPIAGGYQNPYVSISNVAGGNSAYLSTASYANPGHWIISAVPSNETPGLSNGGANTAWINSMRQFPPSITLNGTVPNVCSGAVAQTTTISYSAVTNSPTTYTIDWASPLLTDVNNAVLNAAPGAIPVSIPANLPAGNYTGNLWVSNGSGQSCTPVPVSFTINPLPNLMVTPSAASFCAGGSGVGLTASGAASYTWSPATGLSAGSGSSVMAAPVTTQTYTVAGTDANGCVQTATATITVNPIPLTPLFSVTNPACGELTGTIQITAPLGSGFAYSINGSGYQSSPAFPGFNPGSYSIVAMDGNNCISAPASATVQAPPLTPSAPAVSIIQPTCNVPTGTININAPTGASFSLNNGPFLPVSSFTNLAPGTYTVTAQNAAGCFSTATNVTINAAPVVPMVSVNSPVICTGANATIIATVNPLTSYNFSWTVPPTAANPGNVPSFVATVAGTYTVTVTNSSGCSTTASGVLTVQASAPVTANNKQVCAGSVVTLTGTPGGGVWSGTGVVPGSNTFSSAGLNPGTYSVTYFVSGIAGCSGFATANITVVAVPSAPGAGVSNSCSGTSTLIAVNYTGTLLWSNGATAPIITVSAPGAYSVTQTLNGCTSPATVVVASPYITPAAPAVVITHPNCSSATGIITVTAPLGEEYSVDSFATSNTTGIFTGLAPGTYMVMVRNTAGCLSTASAATVLPAPLVPPAPAISVVNYCNGSSVLTASNYTGNLLWSTGASTASITVSLAGNYSLTQTINGCSSAAATVIANPRTTPAPPQIAILQQPDCWNPSGTTTGGSISVVSPAGVGYSYSIDGVNYTNTSGVFTNVGGSFFVTAQSPEGCISNPTLVALTGTGPAIAPTVNVQQPTCAVNSGAITITSPLGSGYSYSIDGINFQSAPLFTNLTPGSYQVTYRVNGVCYSANRTVFITNPPPVPAAPVMSVVQPSCTVATGSLTITSPIGAGLNYSINGTTYQTSPVFNNLAAGSYNVIVRNLQGCVSPASTVNLVPNSGSTSIALSACILQGQTYTLGSLSLTTSGSYAYTFTNSSGCDSVVRLQLVVRQTVIKDTAACGSMLYNGNNYTQSVALRDTVKSIMTSCDSILRITNITIHPLPMPMQLTVCRGVGQTYTFNGSVLTSSGIYTAQLTNSNGCDSLVQLQLVIAARQDINLRGCGRVVYNGVAYTSSTAITQAISSALTGCDSVVQHINIIVDPLPLLSVAANSNSICVGDSVVLKASSNVMVGWLGFGSDSIKVSPPATTLYTAVAMNNAGCTDTARLTIEVKDFSVQLAASANPVFSGNSVELQASGSTTFTVTSWEPASLFNGSRSTRPIIVVDSTVWISLSAKGANGCSDSVGLLLVTDPMTDVYVPNAFTPNGDGRNDLFKVLGGQFLSFDLRVFNRWSELVFATTDRTRGWDGRVKGKDQTAQVYVWILTGRLKNGTAVTRKGTVALIR